MDCEKGVTNEQHADDGLGTLTVGVMSRGRPTISQGDRTSESDR